VSARTRFVRTTFASTTLASKARFNPSTAVDPHRVVSFISVVGCGTAPSNGIPQNRRQVNESPTSRHSVYETRWSRSLLAQGFGTIFAGQRPSQLVRHARLFQGKVVRLRRTLSLPPLGVGGRGL